MAGLITGLLGGLGSSTLSISVPLPTAAAPSITVAPAVVNQAPIILGPLITTFTPPAACTLAVQGCKTCAQAKMAQGCDAGKGPIDAGSCWPGTKDGAPPAPSAGGIYSPGLACPAGHQAACRATGGTGGKSEWPMQFRIGAQETAVGCCPSGFACANVNGQTCVRVVSATTVPTLSCRGASAVFATMTLPDLGARVTSMSIYAPMIQLAFQSSDLSPTAAPTTQPPDDGEQLTVAPGAPESTGLGLGADGPFPTGTEAGPSGAQSGGVSVGAMVGVGVAGGLGFLAVLIGGCWIWQRRIRRRRDMQDAALQKLDTLYEASRPTGPGSLGGDEYSRYQVKPLPARPLGVEDYVMQSPISPVTHNAAPAGRTYQPYRPSEF